jgi:hypothetical protein
VVLGRCVGASLMVTAFSAIGMAGATEASAQPLVPTPTHLVAGPRIDLPPSFRLANPAGPPTLVTPSQAREVTVSMWQLWEDALIARNTTALTELTPPGVLLTGELYNCAWPSGGCVAETSPRPVNAVTTIVPAQHSYPIDFLAEVSTTQDISDLNSGQAQWVPWVELQVLTKANASAPWQLSFDTGYDGTNNQLPPLLPFDLQPEPASSSSSQPTSGATLYNPPPTNSPSTPSSTFLSLLAQYYQSFKDTGNPPTNDRFAVGGAADGYGSQLAENRQGNIALGSRNGYDFSADPGAGEWEFSGAGGLPIECGTVLDTSTNTPVGGPVLLQNTDRTNWGMALAPGAYSKVITTTTHPTCVDDVDGVLDAAGDSGYSTGVTGPSGSVFSTALVVGLVIAAAAVVAILGLVVGVAVVVTRRRRVAGSPVAFVDPAYPWPGGPSGPSGYAPPPPPWPPPPPPPPPPPAGADPSQTWPPPMASMRIHSGFPARDLGQSEQGDEAVGPASVDPGEPSGPKDPS